MHLKRVFTLVWLATLLTGSLHAGNVAPKDSLVTLLRSHPERDTTRVKALSSLVIHLYVSQPDSAELVAREAVALAEEIGYEKGIAHAHYSLGLALMTLGEYEESITEYLRAREGFRRLGDSLKVANTYVMVGSDYIYLGDFEQALTVHLEALEMTKAGNYDRGTAVVANNIGYIYQMLDQPEKALKGYMEASETLKKIGDEYTLTETYSNLASVMVDLGRYEEARPYLAQALDLRKKTGNEAGISDTYNVAAKVEEHDGNQGEAGKYYRLALEEARSTGDQWYLSRSHLNLGEFEARRGNMALAESHLDTMLSLALATGARENELRAYQARFRFYEDTKNYQKALDNYKLMVATKDSIFDKEASARMADMQTKYETAQTEAENQLLRKENARQRILNIGAAAVGLLLLCIVLLLWWTVRQKKKANLLMAEQSQQLKLQNIRLEELNHEKDNLVGIVAHDLKSPVSKVEGLLNLIEISGPLTDEQRQYLQMTQKVTQGAHLLIRNLVDVSAAEQETSEVRLRSFDLQSFLREQIEAFRTVGSRKKIEIQFESDAEQLQVNSDPEFLQRIFDNLVSNALKFSPADRKVFVRLEHDRRHFTVRVRDEGPGMTAEDQAKLFKKFQRLSARPTGGENSSGLGLSIIKALTIKLGGEIFVKTAPGEGAEFSLRFPLNS